jgi:hypothetical protein
LNYNEKSFLLISFCAGWFIIFCFDLHTVWLLLLAQKFLPISSFSTAQASLGSPLVGFGSQRFSLAEVLLPELLSRLASSGVFPRFGVAAIARWFIGAVSASSKRARPGSLFP